MESVQETMYSILDVLVLNKESERLDIVIGLK